KLFVGGKAKNVLIHDVSRDPTTEEISHVDFYEVNMEEKITTKVSLVFVGEAPAVSDLSGILVKAKQELEIRALPADLPHQIEVDISQLKTFDDNILVKDIKLPKNVEILENIETSVATVIPPRSEAELEALKGEIEEKVGEVKVEAEEKAKEREGEEKEEKPSSAKASEGKAAA
ncbi:MAG: 50S ribosomal protein L25, partial [Patescibacteria group bacterium]